MWLKPKVVTTKLCVFQKKLFVEVLKVNLLAIQYWNRNYKNRKNKGDTRVFLKCTNSTISRKPNTLEKKVSNKECAHRRNEHKSENKIGIVELQRKLWTNNIFVLSAQIQEFSVYQQSTDLYPMVRQKYFHTLLKHEIVNNFFIY